MLPDTALSQQANAISQWIQRYVDERPVLQPILNAFQPVLEARANVTSALCAENAPLPEFGMQRVPLGVPLLAEASMEDLADMLDRSRGIMIPALEGAMPSGEVFARLKSLFEEGELDLATLCRAFLDRNIGAIQEAAREHDLNAGVLGFALETVLGPVLAFVDARMGEDISCFTWSQGFCPICGSVPSIAWLSKKDPNQLDSLVGGGGKKHLHCSLCGHDWSFRRDACPACDNSDPGVRRTLHEEKRQYERVEACTSCNTYFPCIDLREYDQVPDLSVAPLGLMHLDIIARNEGYTPLAPAPWNTQESLPDPA